MHVLISSARPCSAFFGNSGSARKGRAIEIISACPSVRIFSATSGVLILLVVINGMDSLPINRFVTQLNPPRGTIVAMVGTRASCQPIPVLIIVAPAFSISFAKYSTSSQVEPSSTRSSIDNR